MVILDFLVILVSLESVDILEYLVILELVEYLDFPEVE